MDIEKITREQIITYLDTTPKATTTWGLLGIGITSYGIAYNPQINTEKWIINKNATSDLTSNQKQADVSQKLYKGDPCFEYVNTLRDKIGSAVQTHVLDIDAWDEVSDGVFKAKKSDCIIAITSYMNEDAVIEYGLYYNGDPVEGTVTLNEEGVPVFTATPAL